MGTEKSEVHRTAKRSAFTEDLKPGDIITGADMLGVDRSVADQLPPTEWLRGEESPFGMDVFDCRANALTMVSATKDPEIADTFSRLRQSDGKEYISSFPEDPVSLEVRYTFDLKGIALKDGPLFKAEQMEDKWDIYRYGHMMYFVRSWTGTLVHVTLCREIEGVLSVEYLLTAGQLMDQRDRMFFTREIFYLIVSHVLGDVYPHPIPSYRAGDEESILGFSFAEFGRRGWYATVPEAVSPGSGGS